MDSLPDRARRSLVELTAASILLIAAMALIVAVLGWVASEGRWVERRRVAEAEVSNVMERLTVLPWDQLSTDEQKTHTLSAEANRALPDGMLAITVHDDGPSLKRVHVEVGWRDASGKRLAPVRLTSWVARRGGSR